MKERTSQLLYAYWNETRGHRIAPQRFEIEPSRIAQILPETFILEREGRHEYMFRLAGTRICDQFGREFRGRNLLDLWTPDDREILIRLLESVTRDGAVGVAEVRGVLNGGRRVWFEMLLLPLLHTGQAITRLLGSLTSAEANPALDGTTLTDLRLGHFEVIWPDGRPHAVVSRTDHQAPFARDMPPARMVRASGRSFKVYDGGLTEARPTGKESS